MSDINRNAELLWMFWYKRTDGSVGSSFSDDCEMVRTWWRYKMGESIGEWRKYEWVSPISEWRKVHSDDDKAWEAP